MRENQKTPDAENEGGGKDGGYFYSPAALTLGGDGGGKELETRGKCGDEPLVFPVLVRQTAISTVLTALCNECLYQFSTQWSRKTKASPMGGLSIFFGRFFSPPTHPP